MNKLIIYIISIFIVALIFTGGYLLLNPSGLPVNKGQIGKCGDGICGNIEKKNGICPQDCDSSNTTKTKNPLIYVTVFSHNEDDERFDMYDSYEGYVGMREIVLKIANLMNKYNASYNFQPDWRFLKAAQKWENKDLMKSTGGKNIIKFLSEDLGVEIDPHSHECSTMSESAKINNPDFANGCNYADVAYLIEKLGVEPTSTVGGFIVCPAKDAIWEKFRSPLKGKVYTNYSWQAEILWGQGTSMHTDDIGITGIWRPKDKYNFIVDDPSKKLVLIGNGKYKGIDNLTKEIESGKIPYDKIYTVSIPVFELDVYKDRKFGGNNVLRGYEKILKNLQPYVEEGKISYAHYSELPAIWKERYNSEPNIYYYKKSSACNF